MCIGGSSPYRECAGVKFARLLSDSPFQAVLSERLRLFSAENIYLFSAVTIRYAKSREIGRGAGRAAAAI